MLAKIAARNPFLRTSGKQKIVTQNWPLGHVEAKFGWNLREFHVQDLWPSINTDLTVILDSLNASRYAISQRQYGFPLRCAARRGETQSLEKGPAHATLDAHSTFNTTQLDRDSEAGHIIPAPPLRAPQPEAREKTLGRRRR